MLQIIMIQPSSKKVAISEMIQYGIGFLGIALFVTSLQFAYDVIHICTHRNVTPFVLSDIYQYKPTML